MSIKAVTFYKVECDQPDCPVETGYHGDYAAWADSGQAADDWDNGGGIILPDGRAFCEEHRAPFMCDDCGELTRECQCEPEGSAS